MKKVISIVGSVAAVAALSCCCLVGCSSSDEANVDKTDQTTVSAINEKMVEQAVSQDEYTHAIEIVSEYVDFELPQEMGAWTIYQTGDETPIVQAYTFTDDGHQVYVAYSKTTGEIHAMDIDRENIIPYSETLRSLL